MFFILCIATAGLITALCIADLLDNGTFVKSPTPAVRLTQPPYTQLPGFCYGECVRNMFFFLFILFGCGAIAVIFEMVRTIKCLGVTIINNQKNLDLLEIGPGTSGELLNSREKAYLLAHMKTLQTKKSKASHVLAE